MKHIALLTISIAAAAFLFGCADTHHMKRAQGTGVAHPKAGSAYIAVPKDGRYATTEYAGSGMMVAQEVAAAFSPYLRETATGTVYENIETATSSAKKGGYDYLVYPQILHWEDRATEWSGRPDVTTVKVSVINVDSGRTVDSAIIGGKSKIMSWGGDRPEDLLAQPLADYAASVFK